MGKYVGNKPSAEYLDWIPLHNVAANVDSEITFTDLNSDFDEYKFEFVGIHPSADNSNITFQANAVGATGFNETITSTFTGGHHKEDAAATSAPYYETGFDQAQATGYNIQATYLGNAANESGSGFMYLFAPSSTTFVKHFFGLINLNTSNEYVRFNDGAGMINITAAIDQISFKMSSGTIDAGTITMFGLAK